MVYLKTIFYDIVELLVFVGVLSLVYTILGHFNIYTNPIYIFIALLILWVSGKMIFRRIFGKSFLEKIGENYEKR